MRYTLRIISLAAGVFIVLAACLLSAGCVAGQPGSVQAHGDSPAVLEGTGWELVSYRDGNGSVMPVLNTTAVTLRFENGSRVAGSAGCNTYFGQYTVSGNMLSIGQVGSTEMYCTEPGVMDQESRYLAALGLVAASRIENDRLILSDAGGQEILQFARIVPPAPAPLIGTKWVLTSIAGNGDAVSSVIAGTKVTAVFGSDGKVTGSAGCNSYGGSYAVHDTGLEIDSVYSTLMYCTEPGVMEQESAFLAALGSAASHRIEGDRLTLSDAAGKELLQFVREEPPAATPLIGTEWILTSIACGDTVSSVVSKTSITAVFGNDGTVTGFAGCNQYFGSYTISGSALTVSQIGSTKMHCTEPGVMNQESAFLAALGSAASYRIEGNRLTLLDAAGKMLLQFIRKEPPVVTPLIGTEWVLTSLADGETVSSAIAGTNVTAVFRDDGMIVGSAGCNGYGGNFTINDSGIEIGSIARTLKLCTGTGVMEQENAFLDHLASARSYSITGDRLELFDSAEKMLLTFRAA